MGAVTYRRSPSESLGSLRVSLFGADTRWCQRSPRMSGHRQQEPVWTSVRGAGVRAVGPAARSDAPLTPVNTRARCWLDDVADRHDILNCGLAVVQGGGRQQGRVEGRRVAGRASVADPALSHRAAIRGPWARFLPPLSEPGVPISGTGLSSGIMRLAHGLAGCDQRAGLASRGTRLTPWRWPAGASSDLLTP